VKLASERVGAPTDTQVISALAACSVIGRLSGGYIVTKVSSRLFAYGALLIQALGLLILSVAQQRGFILLGACFFGLGVGNVLLLHPLLLAEHFGVRDYGKILGKSSIFISIGNAIGPFVMGFARDNLGGYTTAYLLAAVLNVIGFSVFFFKGAASPTSK
jgi:predicted MFS family arabinose efflux permease